MSSVNHVNPSTRPEHAQRIAPRERAAPEQSPKPNIQRPGDSLELSAAARNGAAEPSRVAELRAAIAAGELDTPQSLDTALDRMISDIVDWAR